MKDDNDSSPSGKLVRWDQPFPGRRKYGDRTTPAGKRAGGKRFPDRTVVKIARRRSSPQPRGVPRAPSSPPSEQPEIFRSPGAVIREPRNLESAKRRSNEQHRGFASKRGV
ncbi:hypothetical protein ACHAQJ_001877 [Trichoderma viride]